MKQTKIIFTLLLSFYLLSCNNDDEPSILDSSSDLIEMEGEGGKTKISFVSDDWTIVKVINKNGNVAIFGDSYTIDGTPIKKNYKLELDELGRLDAFWTDKGFSIARNTPTLLDIIVKENSTGEDFNFTIVITSKLGDELKEITVKQKKFQGYTFKNITYELLEDATDSLFVRQGAASYSFNISSSQEVALSPFGGVKIYSHFESTERDAFRWTEPDSIIVKTPSGILNNELYFNNDESRYTNSSTIKESKYNNVKETVTVPAGKSEFTPEVEYRKREVSYTLYLENNRTKQEKVITGKWIELAPTGEYSIIRKN